MGHHVATLVTESDPVRVRRFAEHLAGRDPAVMVGIGRPTLTTAHIAQSHREAASALSAVLAPRSILRSANNNGRVAAFDDVREQLGLMRVAAVLDNMEITDSDDAANLFALDAATGSELSATLLTYLDSQQSVRTTAELLHVHQNTIRYRLATLRDDLGVDINKFPTKRLWLWLRLSTTVAGRVRPSDRRSGHQIRAGLGALAESDVRIPGFATCA